MGPITHSASKTAETYDVSLDQLQSHPNKYNGKTLGRNIVIRNMSRHEGGFYCFAVKDSKTGTRVDKRFDGNGITFITTTAFGQKIESTFGKNGNQTIQLTFSVVKLPIPNDPIWIAVVTKASLVASNGSISKTISV